MKSPERVSLRHVSSDGEVHDLVGQLVLADDERLVVLPAGTGPVEVRRAEVTHLRRVPPRVVRPTSRVDDVWRLTAQAWPGLEQVRMGGWTLYVGGGHTQRANSAHATGDPGRPLSEAIGGVDGFYRARGIRPGVQVASRQDEASTELESALAAAGWEPGEHAVVMTAPLAAAEGPDDLEWSGSASDEWLAVHPADNPSRRAVEEAGDPRFGLLRSDGPPVGCVRIGLVDDWAVVGSLFVTPDARGAGRGRALTTSSMARARALGASFAALQVAESNDVALRVYEGLGFTEHHRYRYWQPVS